MGFNRLNFNAGLWLGKTLKFGLGYNRFNFNLSRYDRNESDCVDLNFNRIQPSFALAFINTKDFYLGITYEYWRFFIKENTDYSSNKLIGFDIKDNYKFNHWLFSCNFKTKDGYFIDLSYDLFIVKNDFPDAPSNRYKFKSMRSNSFNVGVGLKW